MSHGPSTLGSMMTSSLLPTAPTISEMSSSAQGELSALMRVHKPVEPKSTAFAIAMKPARAAWLGFDGDRILEITQNDVDLPHEVLHFRADLLVVRRHKMNHALKPHRQLAQRHGGANGERGKELARQLHETFQKMVLPFRAMQRPRQVGQKWGSWGRG